MRLFCNANVSQLGKYVEVKVLHMINVAPNYKTIFFCQMETIIIDNARVHVFP